jgi:aspartate/glutamate racemase
MQAAVFGGTVNYGQVAGILMLDSTIPRIPGDPGHAATFSFPVRYGVVREFAFEDLVEIRRDNIDRILAAALGLQKEGVNFIAADCGLFSVFQRDIADALDIPFIGSSLSLIPLIAGFLSLKQKIGVITGDTRLLKAGHLEAVGADSTRLVIRGMEHSQEFQEVVIRRRMRLDPDALKSGVLTAAEALFKSGEAIGAILLECTNLVSFRSDIQKQFNVPVFDMVSLIEFFAVGYRLHAFESAYLTASRISHQK